MAPVGLLRRTAETARMRVATLGALTLVATASESAKQQMAHLGALPHTVRLLCDADAAVRAAACELIRRFTRIINLLRTVLVDVDIATPVVRLLRDTSKHVRMAATATVGNLLLEFAPQRQAVIGAGALELLADSAKQTAPRRQLRAALSALKNYLYQASAADKAAFLATFGWHRLIELLRSPDDADVLRYALVILRNLFTGDAAVCAAHAAAPRACGQPGYACNC